MKGAMESLHSKRMTEEEKEKAEQVGVVWEYDSQAEEDHSDANSTDSEDGSIVGYWLKKMDEILPETE